MNGLATRKICAKQMATKRKKFDSTKARVSGDKVDPEQAKFCADKATADKKIAQGRRDSQNDKKKSWKAKSSAFQEAMKAGREINKAMKEGRSLKDLPSMPSRCDHAAILARRSPPLMPSRLCSCCTRDTPLPCSSSFACSEPDPSLVPCPHCGRSFNEKAAERHIPRCKDQKAKPTRLKAGGRRH